MDTYNLPRVEDLEAQEETNPYRRLQSRYKVSADFFVDGDTFEEAEEKIKYLIDRGILSIQEDSNEIVDYDIVAVESAELE